MWRNDSALVTLSTMGGILLCIDNNTKQTVTLNRGCLIARLNQADSANIISPIRNETKSVRRGRLKRGELSRNIQATYTQASKEK